MGVFLSILFFIIGLLLRPILTKWLKKYFIELFENEYKRYEVVFKIELYTQPSLHHLGEEGTLVKSDPVRVQVDAEDEEEALILLDTVIKQEVKAELISIKEIPKL